MKFKILYVEDNNPETIKQELSYVFDVTSYDPTTFEHVIAHIRNHDIDLLLLDFRLTSKEAIYDAPTLAQTIRTQHETLNHKDLPIVLISTEENISGYYSDYTSQDLFDFAITKKELLENVEKYSTRFRELIRAYSKISVVNANPNLNLLELLNVPELLRAGFNKRILELLASDKNSSDVYMASDFILNHIVIPSGVLISEHILLARLGVSDKSEGWSKLKSKFEQYKYTGVFSESYDRWWFQGVEQWWLEISPDAPYLKSLKASEKKFILESELGENNLKVAEKSEHSSSDYFWTICSENKTPLDPIDGFEVNKIIEPWEDKEYFSIAAATELDPQEFLKKVTALAGKRFIEMIKDN